MVSHTRKQCPGLSRDVVRCRAMQGHVQGDQAWRGCEFRERADRSTSTHAAHRCSFLGRCFRYLPRPTYEALNLLRQHHLQCCLVTTLVRERKCLLDKLVQRLFDACVAVLEVASKDELIQQMRHGAMQLSCLRGPKEGLKVVLNPATHPTTDRFGLRPSLWPHVEGALQDRGELAENPREDAVIPPSGACPPEQAGRGESQVVHRLTVLFAFQCSLFLSMFDKVPVEHAWIQAKEAARAMPSDVRMREYHVHVSSCMHCNAMFGSHCAPSSACIAMSFWPHCSPLKQCICQDEQKNTPERWMGPGAFGTRTKTACWGSAASLPLCRARASLFRRAHEQRHAQLLSASCRCRGPTPVSGKIRSTRVWVAWSVQGYQVSQDAVWRNGMQEVVGNNQKKKEMRNVHAAGQTQWSGLAAADRNPDLPSRRVLAQRSGCCWRSEWHWWRHRYPVYPALAPPWAAVWRSWARSASWESYPWKAELHSM